MVRLLLGCTLCWVATSSALASEHPVLRSFGLLQDDLPPTVYLVRSPRPLPEDRAITIQGRDATVSVVWGPADRIQSLRADGFLTIPIDPAAAVPSPPPRSWTWISAADPLIQSVVDGVAWNRIKTRITRMQNFGTRYATTDGCQAAADSLHAFFERQGLVTEFHTFEYQSTAMRNVVATQTGTTRPDSIFVVCAHYDSISELASSDAPGADDNASGVAAVMTAAELLAPISFEYTIKYICFTAEEFGLVGSTQWAHDARAANLAIVGALNFDMVGYWRRGLDFDLEIETNKASRWLLDAVTNAADLYTTMPYEIHVNDAAWWGDHASFWDVGYAAVNHEEAYDWDDPDFNPAYHSTRDRVDLIHEDFAVGSTRIAVATLATLARPTSSTAGRTRSFSSFKAGFGGR